MLNYLSKALPWGHFLLTGSLAGGIHAAWAQQREPLDFYHVALARYASSYQVQSDTLWVESFLYPKAQKRATLGGKPVVYLTSEAVKARAKKNSFSVARLIPAYLDNGVLKVNVVDFLVSRSGKKLTYSNGGGVIVAFRFDCVENVFQPIY